MLLLPFKVIFEVVDFTCLVVGCCVVLEPPGVISVWFSVVVSVKSVVGRVDIEFLEINVVVLELIIIVELLFSVRLLLSVEFDTVESMFLISLTVLLVIFCCSSDKGAHNNADFVFPVLVDVINDDCLSVAEEIVIVVICFPVNESILIEL